MRFKQRNSGLFVPDDEVIRPGRCSGLMHNAASGASNKAGLPNMVLGLHLDGVNNGTTFTDVKEKSISRVNNPIISTAQSVFGGASMYLDGPATGTNSVAGLTSRSHLTIPVSADFDLWDITKDFTISMWVRMDSAATSQVFLAYGVLTDTSSFWVGGWWLRWSANAIRFRMMNGATAYDTISNTFVYSANTWYHIAVTGKYNGASSRQIRLFVDGVDRTSSGGTQSSNGQSNASSLFRIGCGKLTETLTSLSYPFQGYMDDIYILNGYAQWTAGFTPPAASFN